MNDSEIEKFVREYLPDVIHMSLSTSRDNKPWTSEVHFAYDQDLNLYFLTLPSRRHSQEIADNPFVSGAITKQHILGDKPQGVYFEGKAELIPALNLESVECKTYCDRFDTSLDWLKGEVKNPDGHRFYKIVVTDWYVFSGEKYHLSRTKLPTTT